MKYSKVEWLLIALVFGLSIAANLPADFPVAAPVTRGALQALLLVLLAFVLVRYAPLSVIIVTGMLLVGSGTPSLIAEHFQLEQWAVLVLLGLFLLLSLARHLLKLHDQNELPNSGVSQSLQTLFRVVQQGNLAWTHRLIAMGADVNVRNEAGETPLMCAAAKGYADMVQILIQNGANPRLENNRGETALTIALMKGYTRIAESLEISEASKHERREESAKA